MSRDARELPHVSRMKKVLFWGIMLCLPLLVMEVGVRTFFAYQLGPGVLFYGTSLNRERDGDVRSGDMNLLGEYFKYHAHEKRYTRDKETGHLIRAGINARGFRGPEFTEAKAPNVIRVITLGASSTFGFSDRDDETYPYFLEQMLNRDTSGSKRFQVYNLGIPHLTSNEIHALFEAEALPLDPDVVTFYEGVNDSWRSPVLFKKEREMHSSDAMRETIRKNRRLHEGFRWLRDHVLVISVADGFLKREKNVSFNARDVEAHMRGKSENYLENISAIRDECRRRGIAFIVATQQAKSYLVDRDQMKGLTYEQECGLIREDLKQNGYIKRYEVDLLTHERMMADLREWAAANQVPLVDVIAALDERRDCLVSWVHLNAEGNRIVARAFERGILEQTGLANGDVVTHKSPVSR